MSTYSNHRIETLAGTFYEIKSQITALQKKLDAVSEEMALRLDSGDLECTVSGFDEALKWSVAYRLNRKLDNEKLQANWSSITPEAQAALTWKADLSLSKYRELSEKDLLCLQGYIIETKPAKPYVKVEAK